MSKLSFHSVKAIELGRKSYHFTVQKPFFHSSSAVYLPKNTFYSSILSFFVNIFSTPKSPKCPILDDLRLVKLRTDKAYVHNAKLYNFQFW